MDKILLIGIDGLDRFVSSGLTERCPVLNSLVTCAAKVKTESQRLMSWDMVWDQVLSGISSPKAGRYARLTEIFPGKGVSIRVFGEPFEKMEGDISPQAVCERDKNLLLTAIAEYPAARADVNVVALNGLNSVLSCGGEETVYWENVEAGLSPLLADQRENTIVFLFAPFSQNLATQGIRINQWLLEQGYLTVDTMGTIDKAGSKAWFDAENGGIMLGQSASLDVLGVLQEALGKLKVFAKRGSDLKVVSFEDLYPTDDRSQEDPVLYITPKNTKTYLEETLCPDGTQDTVKVLLENAVEVRATQGLLYVSGYHIDTEKELAGVALTAVAPTIMEFLGITPLWKMQEHSFVPQIKERLVSEEASSGSGAGDAVRSRLEALGY